MRGKCPNRASKQFSSGARPSQPQGNPPWTWKGGSPAFSRSCPHGRCAKSHSALRIEQWLFGPVSQFQQCGRLVIGPVTRPGDSVPIRAPDRALCCNLVWATEVKYGGSAASKQGPDPDSRGKASKQPRSLKPSTHRRPTDA